MTATDITAYIQNELEYSAEEPPASPRLHFQQHQHYPTAMHPGIPVSTNSSGSASAAQGLRSGHSDHQAKNSVFSNALSSPVRCGLQNYHLGQGGYYPNNIIPTGNGNRNVENGFPHHLNRDSNTNTTSSNDSSMDMHADSPGHEYHPY